MKKKEGVDRYLSGEIPTPKAQGIPYLGFQVGANLKFEHLIHGIEENHKFIS